MLMTKKIKPILIGLLLVQTTLGFSQLLPLKKAIETTIAKKTDGILGIGLINLTTGDTLTFDRQGRFPMQSVYKFHLALAVLNQVDKGKWQLNQKIIVRKEDLLPDTWSPLRDKYPNGNVSLPLSEIIEYAVSHSDNNACDILFRLMGGAPEVNKYMQSLQLNAVNIATDEETMHKEAQAQYQNWSTPWGAVELLKKFYQQELLTKNTYQFLWKTMVNTTTGPNKIKGLLPKNTVVAHKTGYSGVNKEGIIVATNDIGIVEMPNGTTLLLAIFYSKTKNTPAESDLVVAKVAKACYDFFNK